MLEGNCFVIWERFMIFLSFQISFLTLLYQSLFPFLFAFRQFIINSKLIFPQTIKQAFESTVENYEKNYSYSLTQASERATTQIDDYWGLMPRYVFCIYIPIYLLELAEQTIMSFLLFKSLNISDLIQFLLHSFHEMSGKT